jgi:2-isopropylmalate synthase
VLRLKLGLETIGPQTLAQLTGTSRFVAELANMPHRDQLPFVGRSAFAHKGGVHVSAVMRDPATYEHVDPELIGNSRRVLVSDLSGKGNALYKAAQMGVDLDSTGGAVGAVVERIKELEHQGFQYEAAEASFRLLLEQAGGNYRPHFKLEDYRVSSMRNRGGELKTEATVRINMRGRLTEASAEGCGPVHALDLALRQALADGDEDVGDLHLSDYKVRVLDGDNATAARVRVLIETRDGSQSWGTVGMSDNIIEASYQALEDAINYKLLMESKVKGDFPNPGDGREEEPTEAENVI